MKDKIKIDYYLVAGQVTVSKKPCIMKTILGSCITVCLWDSVLNYGGMNHYLYPYWRGDGLATPRYGNVAMKVLLDSMMSIGCKKHNLTAKVFGGASLLLTKGGVYNVGQRNIDYCKEFLKSKRIQIAAENVGGERGRSIIYFTQNGKVAVKFQRPIPVLDNNNK